MLYIGYLIIVNGQTKKKNQHRHRLHGLSGHYVGPHGCSSTCIVTKCLPKPSPGVTEGFWKKLNFEIFCRCH